MSLPQAPCSASEGADHHPYSSPAAALQESRKISLACGACREGKTKCSGGQPCDTCAARNSLCAYDASSDQRRKIANQRTAQELAQAQHNLDHLRQLPRGIISIFKAGLAQSMTDLVHLMRNDTDLSSLAAFVRNEIRSTLALQRAFEAIDFHIDGPSDLPSLAQHPNTMEAYLSYTGSDSSSAKHYNTDGRVPNN